MLLPTRGRFLHGMFFCKCIRFCWSAVWNCSLVILTNKTTPMQQSTKIAAKFPEFKDCSITTCSVTLAPSDSGADATLQQQHRDYMIWGIIASIVFVVLCFLYYICCSCRRRRRIIQKNGKQQGVEINVRCSSTGNVTESRNELFEEKESAKISKQIHQVSSGKGKKKSSKRNLKPSDDDDDSFDWDAYNQTFHKRTVENEPGDNKKKEKKDRRKNLEMLEESNIASQRSMEIKERRRRIETWNETEKVRRKSNRSLCSRSSESSCSRDVGKDRRRRSKNRSIEENVEPNDGETIQITVIPSLKEVIDQLEEDRLKLESRHKEVLEEKLRLQVDISSSKTHIEELVHEDKRNETELKKVEVNKELVRSGSLKCLTEAASQQEVLRSELRGVHTEKEEMEELVARLKAKKRELAQKLESSVAAGSSELLGVPFEIEVSTAEEQTETRRSHTALVASLDEVCASDYAYDYAAGRDDGLYDYTVEHENGLYDYRVERDGSRGAYEYTLEQDVEAQHVYEDSYVTDTEVYNTYQEEDAPDALETYEGAENSQDHNLFTQDYQYITYGDGMYG